MHVVKFNKQGASTLTGSFGPGDILRCSEAVAKHLVEEAQVADYVQTPAPEQPEQEVELVAKPIRTRRARAGAAE